MTQTMTLIIVLSVAIVVAFVAGIILGKQVTSRIAYLEGVSDGKSGMYIYAKRRNVKEYYE